MSAKIIRPFPYELRAKPPAFMTRTDEAQPDARENFAASAAHIVKEIKSVLAEAFPFRLRRLIP